MHESQVKMLISDGDSSQVLEFGAMGNHTGGWVWWVVD